MSAAVSPAKRRAEAGFDVVIVGGGSAGVVLASRVSDDADINVLLLEAGNDYRPGEEPAAIRDTFHTAVYRAENMWPGLAVHWRTGIQADGSPAVPRRYEQARVMGGGSSVNAMAALRGLPGDYDEWDSAGATGWNWAGVLRYFIRLENDLNFSGPLHGNDGPIPFRRNPRGKWPPFVAASASVLAAQGYPYVEDLNTDFRDGLCSIPVTSVESHRVSAAAGYLTAQVRSRRNLTIIPRAYVTRLDFSGRTATNVSARLDDGAEITFEGRLIVIAAGALHSPALLMRSGVGPGDHLASLGIPLRAHLPGVGRNLQDHPVLAVAAHLKRRAKQSDEWRPAPNVSLRYSSGLSDCDESDCWLSLSNKTVWHPLGRRIAALGISIYKPYSRGVVRLKSPSAFQEPHIEFRMLSDARDLARMRLGLRKAVGLLKAPAVAQLINESFLASFSERIRNLNRFSRRNWLISWLGALCLDGPEPLRKWLINTVVAPGAQIERVFRTDDAMTDWILRNTTGFYHPVGTCKMGQSSDEFAVTDATGKVHGFDNLYVADASLMPTIVRGNTNIPTIMIAERLSESIRNKARSIGKAPEAISI